MKYKKVLPWDERNKSLKYYEDIIINLLITDKF